jgi:hypothetical protein
MDSSNLDYKHAEGSDSPVDVQRVLDFDFDDEIEVDCNVSEIPSPLSNILVPDVVPSPFLLTGVDLEQKIDPPSPNTVVLEQKSAHPASTPPPAHPASTPPPV